jgi:hypothetical protein
MALTAILAKLILMRVLVTTGAITKRYTPELLEYLAVYCFFPVAFQAIDGFMFACKRKPGSAVVEF